MPETSGSGHIGRAGQAGAAADHDGIRLADALCKLSNCCLTATSHELLSPFSMIARAFAQHIADVGYDGHALPLQLLRQKVVFVVDPNYRAWGKLRVKFQKGSWMNMGVMRPTPSSRNRICSLCVQHIAGDLFILFLILLALQEVAVSRTQGNASPPQ